MADDTSLSSGAQIYFDNGRRLASLISQQGTAPLLSKMYATTSLTATNFYNGAQFGQEIGSEIPIIYGEILLRGYVLDAGTLRSDIDPDQLLKVIRFQTGEGPVKGIKGVGEDKLQSVIIGCEETVDSETGKASKPHIGLGEVLGLGGGVALMAAPTIAKLFKKDPLTGKDIPASNSTNSSNPDGTPANVSNQIVDLDGVAIKDGDVLTYDATAKKIVNKKLSDMLRERLELINHCCVEGQNPDGSDDPAGGDSASKPDPCDELQLDTKVTYAEPPKAVRGAQKLLPHKDTNKVYSENIDLSKPATITVHMFYQGLYLKKVTTATPSASSTYGGQVTPYKNNDLLDGEVKIAWCLVVDGDIVQKGHWSTSGYSEFNNSEHFTIDWNPDASSCKAGGSNYTKKTGEIRLYREDNYSSSTDMYFQGLSLVPKPITEKVRDIPKMPTPSAAAGHSKQKDDDNVFPAREPTGGTYKSTACFPISDDDEDDDCTPCAELNVKDVGSDAGQDGSGGNTGGDGEPTTPTTKPTISCDEPRDRTYDPKKLITVALPKWTVTSGKTDDKTVDVSFVMAGGNGSMNCTTTTPGATVAWDAASKTLTVSGDETVVSSTLQTLIYTPGSSETAEIEYTATVKNKDLAQASAAKNFIHNTSLAHPGTSASLTVAIGGTTGTLKILVKGKDIMAEVPTGTPTAMAAAAAASINNTSTTPDYTATASGASVTIKSPEGLGADANGFEVTHTTSGNRTLNGVAAGSTVGTLSGGVNGNKAKVSLGSKLGNLALDLLPAIGGGLIANTLMNTIGNIKVEMPADEEDPNVSVLMQGLMINVPSNYNAETRTYTGDWDYSSFTTAYTTNPAWCLLDFIESKRYGCGNSIRLDAIQKKQLYMDLYEAAKRCDESVSDLNGGSEPRYTINTAIAGMTRLEVLDAIAGVMHSQVIFTSNGPRVVQDRPQNAVGIVTNANVLGGKFSYSGGSLDATYNIVDVEYNNPSKYYVQETLYVQDTADLAARTFELRNAVTAFGCTSQGQATRYGAWMIQTEKTNPQIVSYTAGYDHEKYIPGDIVYVVNNLDEQYLGTKSAGGRVIGSNGLNSVELDRVLADGFNKQNLFIMTKDGDMRQFTVSDGGAPGQYPINTPPQPFVGNVWAVMDDPKNYAFKIISIAEQDNGTFAVTAIKHDADKYSAIDGFSVQ